MVDEKEIMKSALQEEKDKLDGKIENVIDELNEPVYNETASWEENNAIINANKKKLADNKYLWIERDYIENMIKEMDQTTLDEVEDIE